MGFLLNCIECGKQYEPAAAGYLCGCGGLLDIYIDIDQAKTQVTLEKFDERAKNSSPGRSSGVWRYKELIVPDFDDDAIVSIHEGNTRLYDVPQLAKSLGLDELQIKHEGENPSGSFKDRGMTVAVSRARQQGAKIIACASTGNTSASMALYAARCGIKALVLVPEGKVSKGKLAQTIAYGAITIEIEGDFDDCMKMIMDGAQRGMIYPMNSVNPFRPAGQKTIIWELLQQKNWNPPDWIVFPAGNLGNYSAFGLAIQEFYDIGLLKKKPRLAGVQAAGANPFYKSYCNQFENRYTVQAETLATAIRIGNPVNYPRAVRALKWTDGVVTEVDDQEIMDAKAQVERGGIGAEPSSCAAVAGLRRLLKENIIKSDDNVVVIFTGHMLKDSESTLSYHTGKIPGIDSRYAGKLYKLKPTISHLGKFIEKELEKN